MSEAWAESGLPIHCMECAVRLAPDDTLWVLPNGWLSVKYGQPYCDQHAPGPEVVQMEHLGAAIKEIRTSCRLSQFQFAKQVGVSSPTLAKLEQGDVNIRYMTIRMILDNMGLDNIRVVVA